jgi:hypothetical protein
MSPLFLLIPPLWKNRRQLQGGKFLGATKQECRAAAAGCNEQINLDEVTNFAADLSRPLVKTSSEHG